jgi:hypothetical protein
MHNDLEARDMTFDKTKYKVWTWKHPLMLHWIVNPGLAFNELILGQRVPKISLVERDTAKALSDRMYIPCSRCGTIHPALKWSSQNKTAFGNWFGLYCDHCGEIIPCLTNLTSYLILALTFPIWYWFRNGLKDRWLQQQRRVFSKPLNLTHGVVNWRHSGLRWGLLMYLTVTILEPLITGKELTWRKLLIGVPVWILGGLLFGFILKSFVGKKR